MTDLPAIPAPRPLRLFSDEPRFAALGLLLAAATVPVALAMQIDPRLHLGIGVWVKPMKFLVALSVYLLTLALMARWMPEGATRRPLWRAFSMVVVLCVLAEVAWIGGAAAMGTGSHFNVATPAMATLYGLMGLFAVTLTSATLVMGLAVWRNRDTGLPPALHLSVALGLVLTFVLTVPVASWMSASPTGHFVGGTGSDAGGLMLMGWAREGGDLRVAHFFATHALHLVPLAGLAALLLPVRWQRPAVWAAAAAVVLLVAETFRQALAGQPFLPFLG